MSEKRFTVDDDGIYDTQEKKHFKFIAYDWMECDIYECCEKLNEQQVTIERLQEKVTDYEIILSITDDKRTLCKEQQIDDVAFYCERYSDYRCYPLCPNTKDCFKADGTFQEKLTDLKEFWGEKWK